MTTQTSSFSFANFLRCYKRSLFRFKSSGIMCFLLSFIFLPLQYILTIISRLPEENIGYRLCGIPNCYTDFSAFMFSIFVIAISIIIPTNMLSFMHNKRSCDVYHSLPFTRAEMLTGNIVSGLTLILIPIMLNFIILATVATTVPFGLPALCLPECIYWLIAATACFSVTVFVSCQVGTIFDTVIFTVLINASFAILRLVNFGLSAMFLYGYNPNDEMIETTYQFSPATLILGRFMYDEADPTKLASNLTANIIWIFISVALLFVSVIIYKNRKSEKAESTTDKGPLSLFSRIIGTISGGLLLGLLFVATLDIEYEPVYLICIFFGSIITYIIGDIIITRHVRFKKIVLISSVCTAIGVCIISASYMYDLFGYETRIPSIDEIESVTLSHYEGRFDNQPNYLDYNRNITYLSDDMIEAIHGIHQASIDQHNDAHSNENYYYHSIPSITYKLKSGKTMTRRYSSHYTENLSDYIIKIETSDEFMQKIHPIFKINADSVLKVTAKNMLGDMETVLKLNNSQTQTLIEALRADMLNITDTEFSDEQMLGKINLTIPDLENDRPYTTNKFEDDINEIVTNVIVTTSFKNTVAFLDNTKYKNCFDNNIERVEKAYIAIDNYYQSQFVNYVNYHTTQDMNFEVFDEEYKETDFIELTDKNLQVLKDSIKAYSLSDKQNIIIAFQCKPQSEEESDEENIENNQKITGYSFIDMDDIPDNIAKKLTETSY